MMIWNFGIAKHIFVVKCGDVCEMQLDLCLWPNSSGSEAGIFQENLVNTIAADALAPGITRAPSQYKDHLISVWRFLC